jgi:uncharacterized LabA/DUF88 family protein
MDRSAIFVDAGYLLGAGGLLTCGTTSRAAFHCDYEGLTSMLSDWVEDHNKGQLSLLRTYWYDGAVNAVPTADHKQIGSLPYVKVRLGRLIHREQKGVDALIYRDLMTLARERAITCAYLLSGDEDLREGVVAAQDMGVQVVLLGVPSNQDEQSAALIREADEHVILSEEHWQGHFTARSADDPAARFNATREAAEAAGLAYAEALVREGSEEDLDRLLEGEPNIPKDLDVALLVDAEKTVGPLRERQDLKWALRDGFWAGIKAAKEELVPS